MVHVNLGETWALRKIVGFTGQVIPIQSLTTGVRLEVCGFFKPKKKSKPLKPSPT